MILVDMAPTEHRAATPPRGTRSRYGIAQIEPPQPIFSLSGPLQINSLRSLLRCCASRSDAFSLLLTDYIDSSIACTIFCRPLPTVAICSWHMTGTWTVPNILGSFSSRVTRQPCPYAGPLPILCVMEITLTPAQRAWLEAKVSSGEFASLQEAASAAITEGMATEIDDLAWAKPYVDRAREDVRRGDVLTLQEHRARMAARLNSHEG